MASGFEALFLFASDPGFADLRGKCSLFLSDLLRDLCIILRGQHTSQAEKKITLYTKEGLVAVALVWIWFSVFGAVPFMLTEEIPNFFDAFF